MGCAPCPRENRRQHGDLAAYCLSSQTTDLPLRGRRYTLDLVGRRVLVGGMRRNRIALSRVASPCCPALHGIVCKIETHDRPEV
jgi:hypothetical protein